MFTCLTQLSYMSNLPDVPWAAAPGWPVGVPCCLSMLGWSVKPSYAVGSYLIRQHLLLTTKLT